MDFVTHASNAASTFVQQLRDRRSEAALRQVETLRAALDAATRDLEAPLDAEAVVGELAAVLSNAADAEIRRVREQLSGELDAVQRQLAEERAATERLTGTLAQAQAEVALLRAELQSVEERAEAAERDLTLMVNAHTELEAALRTSETECRQLTQDRAQLERSLADAQAAADRAAVQARDLRAEGERLEQALAEANRRAEATGRIESDLRRELAARDAQIERHTAALHEVRTQGKALASQREAVVAECDALTAERNALASQREAHLARIRALEAEVTAARDLRDQRDALAAALEAAGSRLEALEALGTGQPDASRAAAGAGAAQLRSLEASLHEATARVRLLEATLAEREHRIGQLEVLDAAPGRASAGTSRRSGGGEPDALQGEVDRMVSLFDASARAVAEMAGASSSSDLLAETVRRLSIQFSRVAWFRLKGNRLEGEHQIGFDETGDFTKLVIPLTMDSLLARAVRAGDVQTVIGPDAAVQTGTPFGGSPHCAVALPIALNGTTLGVLYADDSDMPETARSQAVHESSIGFARLLAGQVTVLLVRHTHELKALAELRQYAATLLQEAQAMHQADVEAGRSADQIRGRLKENLECASQLYAYRAAMEGTAAAALFDEQIAEAMDGASPFAQDLAVVVGQMGSGDVRITAEAS